jgi:hypothetical protein
MFGETENRFSLTRAAFSEGLRLKSNFLSIYQLSITKMASTMISISSFASSSG